MTSQQYDNATPRNVRRGTEDGLTMPISSEDGSEASYRWELSAVGLPVRSVWIGNVTRAFDSTGRHHAVGGSGCGVR
jgi:hypothetical protein